MNKHFLGIRGFLKTTLPDLLIPLNEADTCRLHVTPKLQAVGWESSPHSLHEQKVLTNRRVLTTSGKPLADRLHAQRQLQIPEHKIDFYLTLVMGFLFHGSPNLNYGRLRFGAALSPTPHRRSGHHRSRYCSHEILSQRTRHWICTAARKEAVFFAYLVAMPRHLFRCRKAFSTR